MSIGGWGHVIYLKVWCPMIPNLIILLIVRLNLLGNMDLMGLI